MIDEHVKDDRHSFRVLQSVVTTRRKINLLDYHAAFLAVVVPRFCLGVLRQIVALLDADGVVVFSVCKHRRAMRVELERRTAEDERNWLTLHLISTRR